MKLFRRKRRSGPKRIGLALGSGAARGAAHLGVLRALEEQGVRVEVVAGTSIGAIVGAAYACGHWKAMAKAAVALSRSDVLPFLTDIRFRGGGLLDGGKVVRYLEQFMDRTPIEDLPVRYAAVATDLASGEAVVFTRGALMEAVRASMAIPGVFRPVVSGDRILVDGALADPVPVRIARELGADTVIAVDLNHDPMGSRARAARREEAADEVEVQARKQRRAERPAVVRFMRQRWDAAMEPFRREDDDPKAPNLFAVLVDALRIMETRVGDAMLEAHPPDVLIRPDVAYLGSEEFHRGGEAERAGYDAARLALRGAGLGRG